MAPNPVIFHETTTLASYSVVFDSTGQELLQVCRPYWRVWLAGVSLQNGFVPKPSLRNKRSLLTKSFSPVSVGCTTTGARAKNWLRRWLLLVIFLALAPIFARPDCARSSSHTERSSRRLYKSKTLKLGYNVLFGKFTSPLTLVHLLTCYVKLTMKLAIFLLISGRNDLKWLKKSLDFAYISIYGIIQTISV